MEVSSPVVISSNRGTHAKMAHLADEGDYPQAQGPEVWTGYCQLGYQQVMVTTLPTAQECLFKEQQSQVASRVGEPFKGMKNLKFPCLQFCLVTKAAEQNRSRSSRSKNETTSRLQTR